MRRRAISLVLCFLGGTSGCATAPVDVAPTQGSFPNMSVSDVRNKVIARCIQKGFAVEESAENLVVCGRLLQTDKERLAAYSAMGIAPFGPVYAKVRCAIYQDNGAVHAALNEWVEAENRFGKKLQTQIGGANNKEVLHAAIVEMGGQ